MPESYKPVTGLFNPPAWMTNAPKPDFMGGVQAGQRNQINKINLDQARREQDYIEQLSQSMQAGQGGQMPDFENMLQTGMEVALRTDPRKVMELARAQFNLQRQKEYDSYRNQPQIRNAPNGDLIRIDPNNPQNFETIMRKPPKEPSARKPTKGDVLVKGDQEIVVTSTEEYNAALQQGFRKPSNVDPVSAELAEKIRNAGQPAAVPTPSNTPMPESTPSKPIDPRSLGEAEKAQKGRSRIKELKAAGMSEGEIDQIMTSEGWF